MIAKPTRLSDLLAILSVVGLIGAALVMIFGSGC
jgi:hypothetical protein